MKNHKNLVIFTAIVTIVAITGYILGIVLHYNELREISLAIFGSALLGMIMSLSSYFTSKQEEINETIYTVDKYMDRLLQIEPAKVLIPMRLFIAYLYGKNLVAEDYLYEELERNQLIKPGTKRGLSVKGLYYEWIKQTMPEDSDFEQIEREATLRIEEAKQEIDRIILEYEKMPSISIEDITAKLKKLNFFNMKKQNLVKDIQSVMSDWIKVTNGITGKRFEIGQDDDIRYLNRIRRIQRSEEQLFDYGEWGKYSYEEEGEEVIFTYRQRNVSSKYCKQIMELGDKLQTNECELIKWLRHSKKGKQETSEDIFGFSRWTTLIIAPKQ